VEQYPSENRNASLTLMNSLHRLATQIAITAAISILAPLTVPIFADRNPYKAAVDNSVKNPSPENAAIVRTEGVENQRVLRRMRLEGAGVLFVFLNTGLLLIRKRRQPHEPS
jgi:hypothetical protein